MNKEATYDFNAENKIWKIGCRLFKRL